MIDFQFSEMLRVVVASRRYAHTVADRKALIEKIVRVDHAGELGADRIYAGQMAVLSGEDSLSLSRCLSLCLSFSLSIPEKL